MKEQQTYPIEWEKNRVAYCNNNFIGMVIYELTYWFAKNIHGDPINGKHSYRGDFKTEELAMSAVEDAFRSFIRDVTKQGGDK